MEYLIQGKLDNTIHTITEDQLRLFHEDNFNEMEESRKLTLSSYRGESAWFSLKPNDAMEQEYLLRDPKTAGMRMYYPHGIVINQGELRNYYRGENQLYPSSVPSLLRALRKYESQEEKELYRLVADMRTPQKVPTCPRMER